MVVSWLIALNDASNDAALRPPLLLPALGALEAAALGTLDAAGTEGGAVWGGVVAADVQPARMAATPMIGIARLLVRKMGLLLQAMPA
jgi:hypothetical protein